MTCLSGGCPDAGFQSTAGLRNHRHARVCPAAVRFRFSARRTGDSLGRTHPIIVMAGLVPAIHAFSGGNKHVDARDKPAHDDDHVRVECTLTTGFVEPDSRDVPASFDSRYFGPVASDAIVGRLVPLWTW
jgi:hypothetical protein